MPDAALIVDVPIQFGSEPFTLRSHDRGFTLSSAVEGDFQTVRHWSLGAVGSITTSSQNVVEEVRISAAVPGSVDRPDPGAVVLSDQPLTASVTVPVSAVATVTEGEHSWLFDVRMSFADVAVWRQLVGCEAYLGVAADGRLARVFVEAAKVEIRPRPIVIADARCQAILQQGRFLNVNWFPPPHDETAGRDEDDGVDVPADNARISQFPDGTVEMFEVYDVQGSGPEPFDQQAPDAAAVRGWIGSPARLRGTTWRDGGERRVAVALGTGSPDSWQRLARCGIWVGSGVDGEVQRLVFTDVEEPPPGWNDNTFDDDMDDDPRELPRLSRLVDAAPSFRFRMYELEGELACSLGYGSERGVPSSLELTFGDDAAGRTAIVTSSRDIDEWSTRVNLLDALIASDPMPSGLSDEQAQAFQEEVFRARLAERDQLGGVPWGQVEITVDGMPRAFARSGTEHRWAAYALIDDTMVSVASHGYTAGEVALASVTDLAQHVDHARARERERIDGLLTPEGRRRFAERYSVPPEQRERRRAANRAVEDLVRIAQRRGLIPAMENVVTRRVTEPWGGSETYEQLFRLHTMLRPINGHGGGGDWPKLSEDGSARMRVSLTQRPTGNHGGFSMVMVRDTERPEAPELVPDRDAILRGEPHEVTLRLVPEDGLWKVDTDLLAILIERVGDLETLAQPATE